ncbi:MAG: hypothetical protein K0S61_639 [Anaerocolumna sp.]|jgi:hypothetical protein|nr:hypothetical protein [Anaerocolumna sp.]
MTFDTPNLIKMDNKNRGSYDKVTSLYINYITYGFQKAIQDDFLLMISLQLLQ